MTRTKTAKRDVNKRKEIRQGTDIALPAGPPPPSPSNVEDIPIIPIRNSTVVAASCTAALCTVGPRTVVPRAAAVTTNVTTTITNQFFPTLQVGEYEEKEKVFIPPPSTASTTMTQSRTGCKRAPTMKTLEAENTSKRDTGQGKDRSRDKGSTDRRGGA